MRNKTLQVASLNLFHSVLNIDGGRRVPLSYLAKYGIILVCNSSILNDINKGLADLIIENLGIKSSDWIQSFHKTWNKVSKASLGQLIAEQLINYFSTYGMESLGLESFNYVPVEKVFVDMDNAPSLESFKVVRVIDEDELKSNTLSFVQSVKSPNRDSIEYIKDLIIFVKDIDVDSIKSFEIKTIYCNINNIVPSDGSDFLRYIIYKASSGSLTTLVKDKKTIELLKLFSRNVIAEQLFKKADLKKLSESFYRFKPLFLAFKQNKRLASKINKIRRYAVSNHKPLSGFVVSNIMNLLSHNRKEDAIKVIEKADIRELVKLVNFANYESNAREHVYNIRNGKVYVNVTCDNSVNNIIRKDNLSWLANFCKEKLKSILNNFYLGKVFYIPEGIEYPVPVSEKQMMDTLPYGTRIKLPKDANAICIGGHWVNQDKRIDLDFHLNSFETSFGWNSNYRSPDRDILFSGDMTNAPAPNGAVEAYRISSSVKDPYFLSVNVYNTEGEIPFELVFTKDITSECNFCKNSDSVISAVMNPENFISPLIKLKTHSKEEMIGFYHDMSFILYGGELSRHSVPHKEFIRNMLNASMCRCEFMMTMREFIELAGGKVVSNSKNELKDYVDLSMDHLTNKTLINIVDKI